MIARTPKAQGYSLVPGSLGPRRDFRITVGLREGWDADGRVFDVTDTDAVRAALDDIDYVVNCIAGSSRTMISFELGVFDLSAVDSNGTSELASGK